MTLNEMVDNILQIARNNNVVESEHISRIQIEKWIISYRAMLIKQDIDKGRDINELYITTICPIHLDKIQCTPGNFRYVGDREIPKLIDFNYKQGLISVKDMFGNLIQVGSQTKQKYQRYSKYASKDYIAWIKGNKIYVESTLNELEWISIDVIVEDPTDLGACFDPNKEFPVPAAMIPTITQMILERELNVMLSMPSDTTNNSADDTQNIRRK